MFCAGIRAVLVEFIGYVVLTVFIYSGVDAHPASMAQPTVFGVRPPRVVVFSRSAFSFSLGLVFFGL